MLVGPQHRAVKIVQNAIAVRSQQRHVTRRRDKRLLQLVIACLGKSGGKADSAATSHARQFSGDINGGVAVDSQKGRVGGGRKIIETSQAGNAANLIARRMDWPDVAVEPGFQTLRDHIFRPPAAKDGDRTGSEKSRQVPQH